MRRTGGSSKPDWVLHEGELVGLQMGADFTSEHEWGIKSLSMDLGIIDIYKAERTKVFGAERYRVKDIRDCLWFYRTKTTNESVLLYDCGIHFGSWLKDQEEKLPGSLNKIVDRYNISIFKPFRDEKPGTIATAWDGNSFGIHVKGKKESDYLEKIKQALLDNNAIVYLGEPPLPAFSNSSLNIMILSEIPQEGLDHMKDCDKTTYNLKKDAEKTGIAKKLDKAGKKYFALRPRRGLLKSRVSHGEVPPSKYNIMFCLNPMDQHINNSGWFTVEELQQWIKNEGPVVKVKETA